jgi:regulator of protease activity HflC (stomatin/prohibitin superfamily)
VAIGFRAVYIATLLMCLLWLASNVRQIPPDSQAVVLRFGSIVRTQEAGLLLGWPRPIEQVYLLPGVDRLLSQTVAALPTVATGAAQPTPEEASTNADTYLTGDGGVVLLDATLIYRITDPQSYILAERHVAPALNRVFHATAVKVTARRGLNDFLVARPNAEGADAGQSASPMSAALRDELIKGVSARLQTMSAAGSPLGIEVDRIDLTARLPPVAKVAFDSVLTATQAADQNVATARTQAERRRQGAERERDRLLSSAQATATEHITTARVDTASIRALENELRAVENEGTSQTRDSLLQRVYRDRVAGIIGRIGTMSLVDPQSGARFVMPGRQ